MSRHVVDASVVIKWFVEEIHADQARKLQDDQYELVAPDLLWPESGNILSKKVQRAELMADEARLICAGLDEQPIHIFPSSLVLEPALEIALETGRTVYDSCYLALAVLTECQLVTADQRLVNSLQGSRYARSVLWVGHFSSSV
ncbi:MAG TPA: type II toxin-antitoxin system VapC family toxin [Blastocatellia bacterium]|nr:type II toxin-antitoxin system VapC family toxin [Blastocatellia bacterium]